MHTVSCRSTLVANGHPYLYHLLCVFRFRGSRDGYVAAGGPGYTSHVDTVGRAALEAEQASGRTSTDNGS